MTYQQISPRKYSMLPPAIKNLLIINGLIFLASIALTKYDLNTQWGLYYFGSPQFNPLQLITTMFLHGDFGHILFNMFSLWMFGSVLENIWGAKRFLIFYFASGIGASLMHIGVIHVESLSFLNEINLIISQPKNFVSVSPETKSIIQSIAPGLNPLIAYPPDYFEQIKQVYLMSIPPAIGASGAVTGVLVAFGVLFPNTLLYLYFAIPVKAKYVIMGLIAYDLFLGLSGANTGVAHFAHLGGGLIGFLLILFWKKKKKLG